MYWLNINIVNITALINSLIKDSLDSFIFFLFLTRRYSPFSAMGSLNSEISLTVTRNRTTFSSFSIGATWNKYHTGVPRSRTKTRVHMHPKRSTNILRRLYVNRLTVFPFSNEFHLARCLCTQCIIDAICDILLHSRPLEKTAITAIPHHFRSLEAGHFGKAIAAVNDRIICYLGAANHETFV